MYYCENCGRRFAQPLRLRESYGLPGPWYQELMGCPYCRETGVIGRDEDEIM